MDRSSFNHFLGGALGGTVATAATWPLDVIKTRLQSSKHEFEELLKKQTTLPTTFQKLHNVHQKTIRASSLTKMVKNRSVIKCIIEMIRKEGPLSLYKGLAPAIISIAPTRAIYFYAYSSSKQFCNQLNFFTPNTSSVHMASASFAGLITSTCYTPIGMIKTRLQLHHGLLTTRECIARIYNAHGMKGFFKGLTASYLRMTGIVFQFVLYEYLKSLLNHYTSDERKKFFGYIIAGSFCSLVSCSAVYPHEVIRTRLQEEGSTAKGLFRTIANIYGENGIRSLYRGLTVQLIKNVPNSGISFGVYEAVLYLLQAYGN